MEIDLDDLLITKEMKRQRREAMKETESERQMYDALFNQSAHICSQNTICANEVDRLPRSGKEAYYLSGASQIEKPVLIAALQKLGMTAVHPNLSYAIAVQLIHR